MSLLHTLFYARAAGGFPLIDTEGGAQQDRIVGGAHQLANRIADDLSDRLHLGEPVETITQGGDLASVTTRTGQTWLARHIVVAIPPPLAGRIRYDPPLPAERDALTQRLPMGAVVKIMAVYPEPFWRTEGLSGQAISLPGPIGATFDSSPADSSHGVLLGFLEGAAAREHLRQCTQRRRTRVLDVLARLFGPRAATPGDYLEQDWTSEPFSRGGYSALFPPGAWTQLGPALRRSVGRIHWTGTETSTHWYGYIEGAIRAGEHTARKLRMLPAHAPTGPSPMGP